MTPLYTISILAASEGNFSAEITFSPAHAVFAGHFPGKPIVPGVLLVEITAAVASRLTGMKLTVMEASVIKFLRVIEPLQHPVIIADGSIIEEKGGWYKVDMSYSSGGIIFAKLRGIRLQT